MSKHPRPDFRRLLAEAKPVHMAWLGLGVPLAVEIAADAGWQAAMIDQQHGMGGPAELSHCLTAAQAASMPALVRVPWFDFGQIGRALDAGAQGVIVPMVETAADAARVAHAVKFPPAGGRSHGPYRARLLAEGDYFHGANDWTIACGQIETATAIENVEDICATPGFDMICVGPNDLAISLAKGRARDIRAPEVLAAIERARQAAARHGVIAAIFANDLDYAKQMAAAGWQVISVGTDMTWLAAAARQMRPNV